MVVVVGDAVVVVVGDAVVVVVVGKSYTPKRTAVAISSTVPSFSIATQRR